MTRPPPRSTLFPYPTLSRSRALGETAGRGAGRRHPPSRSRALPPCRDAILVAVPTATTSDASSRHGGRRSEEHTSELQSPCNLVCRLLLEKKKQTHYTRNAI